MRRSRKISIEDRVRGFVERNGATFFMVYISLAFIAASLLLLGNLLDTYFKSVCGCH